MTFIKYFASQNTAIIKDGASTNEFGCNTYIQSVKKNQKIKISELLNHPDISLISGPLEKNKGRKFKIHLFRKLQVSYASKRMCIFVTARSWHIF